MESHNFETMKENQQNEEDKAIKKDERGIKAAKPQIILFTRIKTFK